MLQSKDIDLKNARTVHHLTKLAFLSNNKTQICQWLETYSSVPNLIYLVDSVIKNVQIHPPLPLLIKVCRGTRSTQMVT